MKVIEFKENCFCKGVIRALKILDAQIRLHRNVYVLGEIIHNEEILKKYKEKGVKFINPDVPELMRLKDEAILDDAVFVIGAHGVSPFILGYLVNHQMLVMVGECPIITATHRIIMRHSHDNIFYVGRKNHQESNSSREINPFTCFIYKDNLNQSIVEDKTYNPTRKSIMITQTTCTQEEVDDAIQAIESKNIKIDKIYNTICPITKKARENPYKIPVSPDAVVFVVGGKNSANTINLYTKSLERGLSVYHIQTKGDIEISMLSGKNVAYILAGTSTPPFVVKEIKEYLALLRDR